MKAMHSTTPKPVAKPLLTVEEVTRRSRLFPELLACIEDVLDADGDLYVMDFDRYRAAILAAKGGT